MSQPGLFPPSVPVPNPVVLAWVRSASGFDTPTVAKRLQVKAEKLEAWEDGRQVPTIRQLKRLAEVYHRPLSLFFQPNRPSERPIAAEYRRLPNVTPGQESPELRLAIRHMLARRDVTLDLMDELGYDVETFSLAARMDEQPRGVGQFLRHQLGVSIERQLSWKDGWQAWREWRQAIEDLGVLVFMYPKVALGEARGVALLRSPMPVVAVNTKEDAASRPYTALHELIHLMLSNGHAEASALEDAQPPEVWDEIERFADEAAGALLVPEDSLDETIRGSIRPTIDDVRLLALRYHVTPLAMATRLWRYGRFSGEQYSVWRKEWNEYVNALPERPSGFATPVSKALGRGGRGYCQLVLEALDANRITFADAARHLNIRSDQFDTLRNRLVAGTSGGGSDE